VSGNWLCVIGPTARTRIGSSAAGSCVPTPHDRYRDVAETPTPMVNPFDDLGRYTGQPSRRSGQ
jgi:hypothetical protein